MRTSPNSAPHLSKLGANLSRRNRHYDGFHCSNLLIREALLLGNAKVMLHSRITAQCHSRSEMDQKGLSRLEYLIVSNCIMEVFISLLLCFWKHHQTSIVREMQLVLFA